MKLDMEKIFYQDGRFLVLRTDKLKGHAERIMIVSKEHRHSIPRYQSEFALDKLIEIGRRVFHYTPKFIIMDTTFATTKKHWHLVASDLNPASEDFNQILRTKWIADVDVEEI